MRTAGRRDELIAAAANLLDRGGPAAVTLREVGRAAGVSHNAPYRHFRDKDDLLASVAARELTQRTADAETRDLAAVMKDYVAWGLAYPERFRLASRRWTREAPALSDAAEASRGRLVALVAAAQARGEAPEGDAERLAALLLALANGAVELALAGHLARDGKGRADPQDLVDDLLTCLSRAG